MRARPVSNGEDGLGAIHGCKSIDERSCGLTSISGLSMFVLIEAQLNPGGNALEI